MKEQIRHFESIWINPKLSGAGYCAVKQYEDEFLYVSRGGLNQYTFKQEMGDPRLILISFEIFDITLIGTDEEDKEFMTLLEKNDAGLPSRIHRWALKLLNDHMKPEWWKYVVNNAYTHGLRAGRNDIRRQLATLLREEN